jgi:hypothetical protein
MIIINTLTIMKALLTIIFLAAVTTGSFAQSKNSLNKSLDANFALGDQQGSFAVLFLRNFSVLKSKKLEIGIGGRATSYIGLNQYFITAPATITSGSTSPLIFFQDINNKNIDSLIVKSAANTSINAAVSFTYKFSPKFNLGFNIDLIGVSFGGSSTANYRNGAVGKNTTASPANFNLLLISDNDLGSLNSEFYGRYNFNEKWGIKFGLQFLFTEFKTETKVQTFPQENDRFRNKSYLPSIGVTYRF